MPVSDTNTISAEALCERISGKLLTEGLGGNQIRRALTGDLLSWIMACGEADCAWVTVQTHMNVVAVAALKEMAAVIVAENVSMGEAEIKKAEEESVAIISSPLDAYEICGLMHDCGIPAVRSSRKDES